MQKKTAEKKVTLPSGTIGCLAMARPAATKNRRSQATNRDGRRYRENVRFWCSHHQRIRTSFMFSDLRPMPFGQFHYRCGAANSILSRRMRMHFSVFPKMKKIARNNNNFFRGKCQIELHMRGARTMEIMQATLAYINFVILRGAHPFWPLSLSFLLIHIFIFIFFFCLCLPCTKNGDDNEEHNNNTQKYPP